jgi:hypothetical protein
MKGEWRRRDRTRCAAGEPQKDAASTRRNLTDRNGAPEEADQRSPPSDPAAARRNVDWAQKADRRRSLRLTLHHCRRLSRGIKI